MITEVNNNIAAGTDRKQQMAAVAQQYEQIFADMMMKSMRETVHENELIPMSTGEKIYTEMLDSEFSNLLVKSSSLGLAEVIVRQMMEKEGKGDLSTSLDALKAEQSYNRMKMTMLQSSMKSEFGGFSNISGDLSGAFSPKIKRWDEIIDKASEKYNVPKNLIAAVITVESAGNPAAQSPVGAAGLMQLMPGTAKDLGVKNRLNPEENILGGTKYLRQLLDQFGGDTKLALAAYNAGPGNVKKYNGVPPFQETQNYVNRISTILNRKE